MNYEILRCVNAENGKIYTVSASSTVTPTVFKEQEAPHLTGLLRSEGIHAVLRAFGMGIFNGTIRLQPQNCPIVASLQRAADLLKPPLCHSLDQYTAGAFIATVAENLQKDPFYSPIHELKKLEELRSDPASVLAICKNNPSAFNFSEENVRRNRDYALLYIKECAGSSQFVYPTYFRSDKELAMEALKQNGDIFRQLGQTLRGDREVVRYAYNSRIPRAGCATRAADIDRVLMSDHAFMREIASICTELTVRETPFILYSKSVAEAWVNHNTHVLQNIDILPDRILADPRIRKAIYDKASTNPELRAIINCVFSQKGINPREYPGNVPQIDHPQ